MLTLKKMDKANNLIKEIKSLEENIDKYKENWQTTIAIQHRGSSHWEWQKTGALSPNIIPTIRTIIVEDLKANMGKAKEKLRSLGVDYDEEDKDDKELTK